MKKLTTIVLLCLISTLLLSSIPVNAAYVEDKYISSAGACVIDYETGEILYEHNGYINRSPASMTKVMSLYCIYRELEEKNISFDTQVPISRYVYDMPVLTDYQCIPLNYNTKYTVDDLIGAVATFSASNALMALVEFVSGSEKEFVVLMNKTAKEMGLNAVYYDSCGGYTNEISPVDMAKLARNIISDYPDIIARTSKAYIVFNGLRYYSTNKLYNTYYYEGADGLKTGTSSTAGYCFCGTAVRNGRRVISVTMCSASNAYRFKDSGILLDYGFKKSEELYVPKLCYSGSTMYINGQQMPVLDFTVANKPKLYFIVENLNYYGFDVHKDEVTNTIYAVHNPQKEFCYVDCSAYAGKPGDLFANVLDKGDLKLILKVGQKEYNINNICASHGCHLASAEELGYVFDLYWDSDESSIFVYYPNNTYEHVFKTPVFTQGIIFN